MKRSAQVLVWIYSRLLHLYPRQYRAEYGEELQTVFSLVVNEAAQQGVFSIIRLGWRELRDLPGAAIRQHWQEWIKNIQKGKLNMKGKTAVEAKPWWQVGLAILPGVMMFVDINLGNLGWDVRLPPFVVLSVFVLLSVSSIVWAIARRRSFGVAAWGLIPLGWLVAWGLLFNVTNLLMYFVLLAVGLLLVKYSGLRAGLFVLAGGLLPMGWNIEPAVFLWDSPFWNAFSEISLTVLFFILTPIWVLRARSVYGQAAGLLLPIVIYFVALVSTLSAARGFSIAKSASISAPVLVTFTVIAVAVVLYGGLSPG